MNITIIGEFTTRTPADLPPDGFIPANWDGPGVPVWAPRQFVLGEALIDNNPANVNQFHHVWQFTAPNWIDLGRAFVGPSGPEGPPGPQGIEGETGPPGVNGAPGVATIIVGEFTVRTSAELPVDGFIPVDWDGPGKPATAFQMQLGQSLIDNNATDADVGDLFQYISTVYSPSGWINIGKVVGPPGADGADGADADLSTVVKKAGDTMTGQLNMSGRNIAVMKVDNNNGNTSVVQFTRSDFRAVAQIYGYQQGYNSSPEGRVVLWASNGGWSPTESLQTVVASPGGIFTPGNCSAASFTDRAFALREEVAPVTDEQINKLMQLRAVTYKLPDQPYVANRGKPKSMLSPAELRPERHFGFDLAALQSATPEVVRIGDTQTGELGYQPAQVLALAIAAIQKLTLRVQELETQMNSKTKRK